MGAVKRETRSQGRGLREWDYVSLSETRTIAHLIRNRSKLDDSYLGKMFEGSFESNGIFPFSEPVIVTYLDLDRLIEQSPLSDIERFTINKLMLGYTLLDLEEIHGIPSRTFADIFSKACQKIKETNDRNWLKVHVKNPSSFDNYSMGGVS